MAKKFEVYVQVFDENGDLVEDSRTTYTVQDFEDDEAEEEAIQDLVRAHEQASEDWESEHS